LARGIEHRSIFRAPGRTHLFRFRVGDVNLLSVGRLAKTVTLSRPNISRSRFWARPLRTSPASRRQNAIRHRNALRASSAEIVSPTRRPASDGHSKICLPIQSRARVDAPSLLWGSFPAGPLSARTEHRLRSVRPSELNSRFHTSRKRTECPLGAQATGAYVP